MRGFAMNYKEEWNHSSIINVCYNLTPDDLINAQKYIYISDTFRGMSNLVKHLTWGLSQK